MWHFVVGVRFHLDLDLVIILKYFDLPLCHYNPASIWCKDSFLSLLCLLNISLSLDLFSYFFFVYVMKNDRLISVGACQNRKLIIEIPRKLGNGKEDFSFSVDPTIFPFPNIGNIYGRDTLNVMNCQKRKKSVLCIL